jgi:glutamate synthase (ferredoxin)
MSGGVAYVLDEDDTFPSRCNQEMVRLFRLEDGEEFALVHSLIQKHFEYTQSVRAKQVLQDWAKLAPKFWKVYPNDYRRVIETQRRFREQGLSEEEAVMAAFEANAHDAARLGGK